MPSDHTPMLSIRSIWCQRRDSNSQTPVSKTGCYSNSHTLALWCTGGDLNLRVPLGETGLQPVRFGRAHAPVLEILRRKVRGSGFRLRALPFAKLRVTPARRLNLAEGRRIERPSLITMPWFSGPVAGHSAVPSAWRRVRELNPLASCESLVYQKRTSRQVPYHPAHSPLNCQRTEKESW